MELHQAELLANNILRILEPTCQKVTIAGSIRRQKPDVGDIEILAIPKYVGGVDMLDAKIQTMIHFDMLGYRLNKLGSRVYGPKNKLLVHLPSGIGVDIFSTDFECWPVALVVRTGGKVTNQRISMAAIKKGFRFHAYGRGFSTPRGEIVCRSEREVFEAVNLPYLEPWQRE